MAQPRRPSSTHVYPRRQPSSSLFSPSMATDIINMSAQKNSRALKVSKITLAEEALAIRSHVNYLKAMVYYLKEPQVQDVATLLAFCYASSFISFDNLTEIDLSYTLTTILITGQLTFELFPSSSLIQNIESFFHVVKTDAQTIVKLYKDLGVELNDKYQELICRKQYPAVYQLLLGSAALTYCMIGKKLKKVNLREWIENQLTSFTAGLSVSINLLRCTPYPTIKYYNNLDQMYCLVDQLKKDMVSAILIKSECTDYIQRLFRIVAGVLRGMTLTNFYLIDQIIVRDNPIFLQWGAVARYLPHIKQAYQVYSKLGSRAAWCELLVEEKEIEIFRSDPIQIVGAIAFYIGKLTGTKGLDRFERYFTRVDISALVPKITEICQRCGVIDDGCRIDVKTFEVPGEF
ncbi:hypothetical protein O3M35_000875 [Rhynocoris fuscipes]|uniref:Uncharacterized protein n=1 Tax=Rhynocoris fuscipes TaxID=488301 RepID=A0AAW1DN92_9HEMI